MKTKIENVAKFLRLAAEVTAVLEFIRLLFDGSDAVYSVVGLLTITTCLAVYFFVFCKSAGHRKSSGRRRPAGRKKTAERRRSKKRRTKK